GLGGHSLLAVRLLARIRQRFGRDLPLAALFRVPTIEALAAELPAGGEASPRSPLVEIQAGRGERPLFLVHPVGGNVLCYFGLARRLGLELPVYGFQTPDLDVRDAASLETVGGLAGLYLESLRQVQPQGPYRLSGWSLGGLIAFEMAWRLAAEGEEVELLALIDSFLPEPESAGLSDGGLVLEFAGDLAGLLSAPLKVEPQALAGLNAEAALALLFQSARDAGVLAPEVNLNEIRRLFETFRRNYWASLRYAPRPYDGRVDLFRAGESGAEGWSDLARVEVHRAPGDHYSLLTEPLVGTLSALLIRRLGLSDSIL